MMTTDWTTTPLSDGPRARPVGTYAFNQPPTAVGIRRYPYSTSLSVNPLTYVDMTPNPEVHAIGEIWCATLWDMTWNIIQMQGSIEPNLYASTSTGGNAVALQLVMQGLKLQPCQPGFLDSRDAILAADSLLYNGRYHCAIWGAFARRGMGVSAREGSSTSATDQTAAFDLPAVTLRKNTAPLVGNQFAINLSATCECQTQAPVSITDQLPADLQYLSSSAGGTLSGTTVTFPNLSFAQGQTRSFQILAQTATGKGCAVTLPVNDDRDANTTGGLTPAVVAGTTAWAPTTTAAHTGTGSWLAISSALSANVTLTSAAFTPGSLAVLSFYQYASLIAYYDTGLALDGGLVAISTDNGTTWTDAGPYFLQNGYNTTFDARAPSPGKGCFSGYHYVPTPNLFAETRIDLSSFNGQSIRVRFQLLANKYVKGTDYGFTGWYLDDIRVMNGCGGLQQVQLRNSSSAVTDRYAQPTFLTVPPVPTISSFTPASGVVGTGVVVTGTYFTGATAVAFNGTAAPGYVVNSATQLTVNVPAGATTGPLTVTSASGTGTSATAFTVLVAPVITVPAALTAAASAGQCGASLAFAATATGSPTPTLSYAVASGAITSPHVFAVGTTTVEATATNTAGTAKGSFTVTVNDVTPPTVVTRNVRVRLVNGTATVTAAQVDSASSDNCGITRRSLSRTTFGCADLANSLISVTLTVTDNSGNQSTGTAFVTVVGTIPVPSIAVTPATNVYTGGIPTNLYLGYGPLSATLTASGGVSYAWKPATGLDNPNIANPVFTATAAGTFTYKVTATSASGCTATASVTLTVLDVRCGNKNDKVLVCHNGHSICISPDDVNEHLTSHPGDRLGDCPGLSARASAPVASTGSANELAVYPNPAGDQATVSFRPALDGQAQVMVYNALGQLVASLYEGEVTGGQLYAYSLHSQDLATGLYECRLVVNGKAEMRRLVIAR